MPLMQTNPFFIHHFYQTNIEMTLHTTPQMHFEGNWSVLAKTNKHDKKEYDHYLLICTLRHEAAAIYNH